MNSSHVRIILVASLACAMAILPLAAAGQVMVVPGTVAGGESVFQSKGCLSCHSLNGKGGTRAPDFANPSGVTNKPALLAAEMWNHAPAMFAEFEAQKRDVPGLTSSEAADLYAYFYAALYFAPKGDANRGRNVFEEKRCVSCHSEVLNDRRPKSLADKWSDLQDPIVWAERMWNHTNEMVSATTNKGINWPHLSERDIVDLLLFLSRLPDATPQEAAFSVGDPGLGQAVFEGRCSTCHSFGPEKSKVDLRTMPAPASITDYIAAMWNHAPAMRKRGGATVTLKDSEMRDLIAFLFAQRYFFDTGDTKRGQKVYETKGCVTCHGMRRFEVGAPDLTRSVEAYSPITLTAAAWRHGPAMLRSMKQQKIEWPEFQKSEMADLIAYLNSNLIVRLAR
jgi:mono/diheme cytochrome c family protein